MPGFGPLGSFPLGALAGGDPTDYDEDLAAGAGIAASLRSMAPLGSLSDGGQIASVIDRGYFMVANDAAEGSDTLLAFDVLALLEHVGLSASAVNYFAGVSSLDDGLTFDDSLQIAWALLLAEDLQLVGAVAANPYLLGAIIDTMHATGMAETRLDALAAVAGAIALEALVQQGWSVEAADTITFNDALTGVAKLIGPLVDAAALAGTAEHALRIVAVAADTGGLDDEPTTTALLQAAASDGILLYATFSIGGQEYSGWVLNTTTKAPSEYRNFNFEAIAFWKGRTFLGGLSGLFEQTGPTDDGTSIEAFVRSGFIDFGTGREKRVPDVYYATTSTGAVVLKVVTTDATGALVEDWYQSVDQTAVDYQEGRFKVGRALKARFIQFELHNVAGGRLDFIGLEWHPIALERRVK